MPARRPAKNVFDATAETESIWQDLTVRYLSRAKGCDLDASINDACVCTILARLIARADLSKHRINPTLSSSL